MNRPPGSGSTALEHAITRRRPDPAIAAFLTAGFPTRDGFVDLATRVAHAADVLEIGIPFSDPMADGVTIQASSRRALDNGVTVAWIFEMLSEIASDTPVVLMTYLNPVLAYGAHDFAVRAARAGAAGIIIPDLPFEESDLVGGAWADAGLAHIQLVSPVSDRTRRARLCAASQGFVYAVATTGTTGGRTHHSDEIAAYLTELRSLATVPVLAGFGIRTADQVAAVAEAADGVIVGSALIEVIDRGDDPVAFLNRLRGGESPRPASVTSGPVRRRETPS